MNRSFFILFVILIMLLMAACAPATPATQEPVLTVEPAITPGKYHPLTTLTGIADIDAILEAAAIGDVQTLLPFIQFTETKCTNQEGMGGPPKCREGEAEGTAVEVLPFLSSEGHFLRKDEIQQWNGIEPVGLYAIYEASQAVFSEEDYPGGKYAILLLTAGSDPALALRIGESGLVRVDTIFDASLPSLNEMIEREASKVILAPPGQ